MEGISTATVELMSLSHSHRLREEEVSELTGTDEFGEFYRKLKVLKDQHRIHGGDDVSVCSCV